jgi:hypothetical protein
MKTLISLLFLAGVCAGAAWWLAGGGEKRNGISMEPRAKGVGLVPEKLAVEKARSAAGAKGAAVKEVGSGSRPNVAALAAGVESVESGAERSVDGVRAELERVLGLGKGPEGWVELKRLIGETLNVAGLRAILARLEADRTAGENTYHFEWDVFWDELIQRDPGAAAALNDAYTSDPVWRESVASLLAYKWALRDPKAAIAWLAGNEALSGEALDDTTGGLILGYAEKDLAAATRYALAVMKHDDPRFGRALSIAAMKKGGVEGLLGWFDGLPNEGLKGKLFAKVSDELGNKKKVAREVRATWLAGQVEMSYRDDQAYRDFVVDWAEEDPAGALGWVMGLPKSPKDGSPVALESAVLPWLEKDAAGFTAHFWGLPRERQAEIVRTVEMITKDPKFPEQKRVPGLAFLQAVR